MELGHWLFLATVAAVLLACFIGGYLLGWSNAWKCADNPDCRKMKKQLDMLDAEYEVRRNGVND